MSSKHMESGIPTSQNPATTQNITLDLGFYRIISSFKNMLLLSTLNKLSMNFIFQINKIFIVYVLK